MAPTISHALNEFFQSLAAIGGNILNSIVAIFTAILALGQNIIVGIFQFVQGFIKLGLDVFQGALGFVAANFFVLLVLGGGYYLYTQRQQGSRSGSKKIT